MAPRKAVAYLLPGEEPTRSWPDGLDVIATVREPGPDADRPGLTAALQRLAAGEAEALVVLRLGAPARSLGELIRLVEWLNSHHATLVALDVGLDTGRAEGRRTALVLGEIERWGREPEPPHRPPGRPGLGRTAPHIAERIALLRQRGLSLRAIADALNAEGIPTPRGGERWRVSSVQSAVGYRRPHPPAPGLPRPGPPPPPRGQGGHQRSGPPAPPDRAGRS